MADLGFEFDTETAPEEKGFKSRAKAKHSK